MARISWPGRSFQEAQPPKPWHHLQECIRDLVFRGESAVRQAVYLPSLELTWSDFQQTFKNKGLTFFCWVPIIVWKGIVCLFRHWLFQAVFVAFCVDPGGDPLDDFTRPQRLLRVVENERRVLQMDYLQVFDVFCSAKFLKMLHSQNWPFYGL